MDVYIDESVQRGSRRGYAGIVVHTGIETQRARTYLGECKNAVEAAFLGVAWGIGQLASWGVDEEVTIHLDAKWVVDRLSAPMRRQEKGQRAEMLAEKVARRAMRDAPMAIQMRWVPRHANAAADAIASGRRRSRSA